MAHYLQAFKYKKSVSLKHDTTSTNMSETKKHY
jgi:hypothetical protein